MIFANINTYFNFVMMMHQNELIFEVPNVMHNTRTHTHALAIYAVHYANSSYDNSDGKDIGILLINKFDRFKNTSIMIIIIVITIQIYYIINNAYAFRLWCTMQYGTGYVTLQYKNTLEPPSFRIL